MLKPWTLQCSKLISGNINDVLDLLVNENGVLMLGDRPKPVEAASLLYEQQLKNWLHDSCYRNILEN